MPQHRANLLNLARVIIRTAYCRSINKNKMFVAAKNLCTQERIYLPSDKESYGVVKGSVIERHYLLMIKSSLEELKSKNKRLGDPKRVAITPAFVKVKDYPLESEKDSKKTQKASTANSVGKAQKEIEKGVVGRFLKASSRSRESKQKHNDLLKTNTKGKEIEGLTEKTSGEEPEKDGETLVDDLTKQPLASRPADETRELNGFNGQCCKAAEELLRWKEKCARLEEENKGLRLAADHSNTLQKMQADLAALKNSTGLKISSAISQSARGVTVEPEFEGIAVPDDKVYIGQGKFISKHEFLEAEDHASFRLRAKALCEAFWPGEVHLYSKTGCVVTDNSTVDSDIKDKTPYRRILPMYQLALKRTVRRHYSDATEQQIEGPAGKWLAQAKVRCDRAEARRARLQSNASAQNGPAENTTVEDETISSARSNQHENTDLA